MINNQKQNLKLGQIQLFTFFAITLFYFFESAQMSYFNVLAPYFLHHNIYQHNQIASLSAAYYYGDMIGLIPVGIALDRFPLRKILLWAILGSIIGAFLLMLTHTYSSQWVARFICGFFGGTFSFVGGIRILASTFAKRFTYYMGLFLAAGMFGGLICQYPLLVIVNHWGAVGAMAIMAFFGIFVGVVSFFYLHPVETVVEQSEETRYSGTWLQMCWEIFKNIRNWLDCIMVVLLDTPVSIIGTLWGIVLLMGFYHFSAAISAWIVMSLFAGLMVGLPVFGELADRFNYSKWIVIVGAAASFLMLALMLISKHSSAYWIAILFFGLGLFSSCQSLGFTWLTKNMKPELIGRNSAFNSMIFMGTNGVFKQFAGSLLAATPFIGTASAANLLWLIFACMLLVVVYVSFRRVMFNHIVI